MPIFEPLFQKLRIAKVIHYIEPGGIVVDVGCDNPPIFLKQIAPMMQYCIGIDVIAPYKKTGNLETFSQKLIKEIKIKSNSTNAVTMLAVLEHLKHPQDIVNECYRILKPGGKLLVTVPAPKARGVLEILAKLNLVRSEMIDQHENYFTISTLEKLMHTANFSKVTISPFEFGFNTFVEAIK